MCFTYVKRAPRYLERRIADVEGVAQVQTRIVLDVTLNLEGWEQPATGRLISIPDDRAPKLNALHLRRGRWVDSKQANEVLVSEAFADAHGLRLGDSVTATINGRRQSLRLVGVVLSPEYLIQIPPGTLLPDDRQYGIFWMSERQLEAAYDMKEAFNNVNVKLLRGAEPASVIERLDQLLEPYGSLGAYDRESPYLSPIYFRRDSTIARDGGDCPNDFSIRCRVPIKHCHFTHHWTTTRTNCGTQSVWLYQLAGGMALLENGICHCAGGSCAGSGFWFVAGEVSYRDVRPVLSLSHFLFPCRYFYDVASDRPELGCCLCRDHQRLASRRATASCSSDETGSSG